MTNRKSLASDFKHAVQELRVWRARQEAALSDKQKRLYQHMTKRHSQKRQTLVKAYKANRSRLIEEEFRKRLLHHPRPVLAMLPVRPKTKERIRQEAVHAVARRHVQQIAQTRQEHRQHLDRYLQLVEQQRYKQTDLSMKQDYGKAKVRDTARHSFTQSQKIGRDGRLR